MFAMRVRQLHFIAAGFLAFWSAMITAGFAYTDKVVRDWEVYCDEVLTCRMQTRPSGENIYTIEFERKPSADAEVTFSLSHRGQLKTGSQIVFTIPGESQTFVLPVEAGEFTNGVWRFGNPGILSNLIPAMRAGTSMQITIETDQGVFSETASLSGSSAVMLFTDEVQDRLGKTDALVATGDGMPTGRQSRARSLDGMNELPPAVLARWKNHADECAGMDGEDLIASFSGYEIKLDERSTVSVFVIPCGGPGAYNLIYAGFLFDSETGIARTLAFPTLSAKGPTVTYTIINVSWDEAGSRLTAFYKGRGLGDCGTASAWQWDNNGPWGAFILVEERSKEDCDGKDDEWPLVWPVQ
jgi:hypothetical protein